MHYTTSCNTKSSAPEDGQNNCPKHVELTGIINRPLLLHLVGCLYYLYLIIFFWDFLNNLNLTLILKTWRIWWAPNNASKWQMGFNSAFKGSFKTLCTTLYRYWQWHNKLVMKKKPWVTSEIKRKTSSHEHRYPQLNADKSQITAITCRHITELVITNATECLYRWHQSGLEQMTLFTLKCISQLFGEIPSLLCQEVKHCSLNATQA